MWGVASEALTRLVIQLAVILFSAKIGGEICERYVRIPAVIGELLSGMIIGAFSIGLALSGTELAHRLEGALQGVYAVMVPIFFVVIGMIVDVSAMGGIWAFGLLITVLAAIGKIVGGGGPGLLTRFSRHGAWRIGIGMMPRGEIALIMAGLGVSAGIIGADLFGVTIMMTIVTTISAPVTLTRAFRNGVSGSRSSAVTQAETPPQSDSPS